jgi:hypothetical protein
MASAAERGERVLFAARLVAGAVLAFVAGAAARHFEVWPGPSLGDAFDGGAAWFERAGAVRKGRRAPITGFDPERQGRVRRGELGDDLLLLTTVGAPAAWLLDGSGAVVHRWSAPFREAFPDVPHIDDPVPDSRIAFQRARLLPGGDLVVVYQADADTPFGYGAARLDKDSRVVWRYEGCAHHDLDIGPDGAVYLLRHTFSELPAPALDLRKRHLRDSVVVLTVAGDLRAEIDLVAAFGGT